jgi:phosphoribosyl 1,2-cyclic phosphodiesterase
MRDVELVFLGTGGARFSTITQKRHTGGIRIITPVNLQIDPGPGAIVYSNQLGLDPTEVDAVAVSHCHPDHYADAQIFVEAMSQGGREKRGTFIGPRSVITGDKDFDSCLTKYHRSLIRNLVEMCPGNETRIRNVKAIATRAQHSDPYAIGFRFSFEAGDVGYSSDTGYYPGLSGQYLNTRLLILCVLRPSGSSWPGHLSSDDAIRVLQKTKPEMCIMTHFGLKMISANPRAEADRIQRESGIRTVAAEDDMRIVMGSDLRVH